MALVEKSVKVEGDVDAVMTHVISVVSKLKAGTPITGILFDELLKLQSLVQAVSAVPADFDESFDGAVRAVGLNAADLASVLLNKPLA